MLQRFRVISFIWGIYSMVYSAKPCQVNWQLIQQGLKGKLSCKALFWKALTLQGLAGKFILQSLILKCPYLARPYSEKLLSCKALFWKALRYFARPLGKTYLARPYLARPRGKNLSTKSSNSPTRSSQEASQAWARNNQICHNVS